MPVRVATYTRISTDEDHQPYSLDAQAERLGAYVKSQPDWELTTRFSDQASGASTERPGLQRALVEARAGRFDLLLVYRVDRFSRSVRGLAQLLEELDAAGVAFRSATEPFDTTTPAGRMMVQMLGVFAEFERATIVDRVIAGMERKAARGGWCGGSRPFGYEIDAATGFLRPKASEAPLVPVIFDRYAHKREGARTLAVWLNESGHRTKAGKPWSHTAVLTVLRNPVYVGKVYFRDTFHDGPHEHLVDEKLFRAVQTLLSERGEDHSKRASANSPFLLAGLIVCERCGKHFVGTSAMGNRYRYRYYTCFTRQRYGTKYCDAERLPAEELDDAVLDALLSTYERTDLFDKAVAAARERARGQRANYDQELEVVDVGIAKAEDSIERYLSAFEAGTLSDSQCGQRLEGLAAKIADLQSRRGDLLIAIGQEAAQTPDEDELAAMRQRIQSSLNDGAVGPRKALLQALVHEIRVQGRDGIVPWFRVPTGSEPKVRALVGSAPPAGLEPAPPAPEAGALSAELRGRVASGAKPSLGQRTSVVLVRGLRIPPSSPGKGGMLS
jgi:site-specific DNA recombinase